MYSTPDVFPLTPVVNRSCNIECCVNRMLQILQNMMVTQGLALEPSMLSIKKDYYTRSAYIDLGMGQNFQNYSTPS